METGEEKLKRVGAEIVALLEKNNIMGAAALYTGTDGDIVVSLQTDFSSLEHREVEPGLHGIGQLRKATLPQSVSSLYGCMDICYRLHGLRVMFDKSADLLDKYCKANGAVLNKPANLKDVN